MFSKLLLVATAVFGLTSASPYPPDATSTVPAPTGTPFFGDLSGNHQPNKTIPAGGSHFNVLLTGGTVSDPALQVTSINNQDGIGAGVDSYTQYSGDGEPSSGWPDFSSWVSFEDMFNNNKPVMFTSCEQFGQADDSGPEVGAIYDSIQQVATETLLDHRFILAVIMQESGGCVRAPTSNFGVRNPGLMQDHDGTGTCNDNGDVQNPCPTAEIMTMVREGSAGTDSGDGLAQCINQSGASDASAYYKAARIYNSGSMDPTCLECGIATHCYASDIANRLTGWVQAEHSCSFDG